MTDQTNETAPRDRNERFLRDAIEPLGDAFRGRASDFIYAMGEALRAGGDSLAKNDYGLAADCFDSAARRIEDLWQDVGETAEAAGDEAAGLAGTGVARHRLRADPTVAYGVALAAGFLVGAFLRAGLDDPDKMP